MALQLVLTTQLLLHFGSIIELAIVYPHNVGILIQYDGLTPVFAQINNLEPLVH